MCQNHIQNIILIEATHRANAPICPAIYPSSEVGTSCIIVTHKTSVCLKFNSKAPVRNFIEANPPY